MKITENDLKIVSNTISNIFNVKLSDWFYRDTISQLDYVYEIVVTDMNNTKNEYRVLINIDDKCLRFEYIDVENCDIIDLITYSINTWYYIGDDVIKPMTILIISIFNYYMQFKKYTNTIDYDESEEKYYENN